MSILHFPQLTPRPSNLGHIGYDHPLIWPTAELNKLADLFDGNNGRSIFPKSADILCRVNNGTISMNLNKWFPMKKLLPEASQKNKRTAEWEIAGLTPSFGEMDHEQQIRMRQTRPDKKRGWMAPAAVISHTYDDPDRACEALMSSYVGAQVIHLKDQVSWYYPERCAVIVVAHPMVDFHEIRGARVL